MRGRAAGRGAAGAPCAARRSRILARCGARPGRERTLRSIEPASRDQGTATRAVHEHSDGVGCKSCILIVEDDADLREALTASLENCGCCTAVAADGIDALERLQRCPRPCLILVDLNMPRLDGGALAKLLHGDERLRGIPVVSM